MAKFLVPTTPSQAQSFKIALGNTTYTFTLTWCWPAECWILSIGDAQGVPIVGSLPLLPGMDMLEQLAYLGLGGALTTEVSNSANTVPGFDTLGATAQLYYTASP